jgi:hypothetical protein
MRGDRWTAEASHTRLALVPGAIVAAVGSGHVAQPSPPNAPDPPLGDSWSGRAFGLTLGGTLALEGVSAAPARARPDTWLMRTARADVDRRWREARPRTLLDRRLADGRVGLSVACDDEIGFRVWAPRHGCYLVSPDGRRVLAAPPAGPAWRWERLVLAQVLPLAAVLRGLELLHASAVVVASRAVAFLGGSGAGKTTLAGRIAARGAALVTDDVLALETGGSDVQAHRGSTVARIDPRELRAMTPTERRVLGPVLVRGEKCHVAPTPSPDRLALGLTYHLVRQADVAGVQIVPVRPYDPALLLGSAFLTYLTAGERLRHQLDCYAAVARTTPLHQVRAGPAATSADVADAVLRHAELALGEHAAR